MCTLAVSYGQHPDYRLVLVANRDEFFNRAAEPAGWWKDHKHILGGRDLIGGGTWLGITKQGRFAAITNYRKFPHEKEYATSRGSIVTDFLNSEMSAEQYLEQLEATRDDFDGYNLLFGTTLGLYYFSNRGDKNGAVPAGVHGLSNHLLNTPWPKVERIKDAMAEVARKRQDPEQLLKIMKDDTPAPDDALPDTGVGLDWERQLSPLFIKMDNYGTRVTTLITINGEGKVKFREIGYDPKTNQSFEFQIGS